MEKLKNGDYCENLTKEQFEELIDIEGHNVKSTYSTDFKTLGFDGEGLYNFLFDKTTLLSFDDFKQRCINTFKK